MKQTLNTGFVALVLLLAISCKKENSNVQTLSIDGNNSAQNLITDNKVLAGGNTVKIGKQVWIAKNLNVSHYRNGDKIPQVKDTTAWSKLNIGAWCWYNNDSAIGAVYGKLYNWYAVNDPRGLAPAGWHIPSDEEWDTLANKLGGEAVAGGKMKTTGTIEAGTGLWFYPNAYATNSSGFTGLPGGFRNTYGSFLTIGNYGNWWSSSELYSNSEDVWYRGLFDNYGFIYRYVSSKKFGFTVRCIRD